MARIYKSYATASGDMADKVDRLLECTTPNNEIITRLVFFGDTKDNASYMQELAIIRKQVEKRFTKIQPVVSYVAQPSLVGDLLLEVWGYESSYACTIEEYKYKGINYLIVEGRDYKELIVGSLHHSQDLDAEVRLQSSKVFNLLHEILLKEGMKIEDIVRQWNYIENITGFHGESQRYQEFNDARSLFYDGSEWTNGYPAATGIGANKGGIMIDVDAIKSKDNKSICISLDNSLQVAAHKYSEEVLLGLADEHFEEKTTPKFERAKAVVLPNGRGHVYISGTAAIRGEDSLTGVPVVEQTKTTMENIEHLISQQNFENEGVTLDKPCCIKNLRVYIKYPEDVEKVKAYLEEYTTVSDIIYLQADVCREELLVEIEGLANF